MPFIPKTITDFLSSKGLGTVLKVLELFPYPPVAMAAKALEEVKNKVYEHPDFQALPEADKKQFLDLYEAESARLKQQDEADIARLKLANEEMANSRAMNIAIQSDEKASWGARNLPYLIDGFITLLYGVVTLYIIGRAFKVVGSGVDMNLVWGVYAALTGMFTTVLQYHRGSSIGAKTNGDALRQIAKAA